MWTVRREIRRFEGESDCPIVQMDDDLKLYRRMHMMLRNPNQVGERLRAEKAAVTPVIMELSLGGAIDGLAIYGADVYAGHKCESYASDGTFCEANVGGDDDEKYEDDFSIAEASTATCDRIFGMCFEDVNVGRVFLYFHYEYVKG